MRVGFLQFEPRFGEVAGNLERVEALLSGAAGADLVVLPELALTGYNFIDRDEVARLAEPVPGGPSSHRLAALAARLNAHLVIGLAERAEDPSGGAPAFYNSAALYGPSGWLGTYRKIHLFDREKLVFSPGDFGFPVFELDLPGRPRIGIMVCFDWRFPESARGLALAGADLLAHPSNLVMPFCQQAMITRCLENRVYAVTCNRTGTEDRGGHRLGFTGMSQVVDPDGEVITRVGPDEEALVIVSIDVEAARHKAVNERNDLFGDRRPEHYAR